MHNVYVHSNHVFSNPSEKRILNLPSSSFSCCVRSSPPHPSFLDHPVLWRCGTPLRTCVHAADICVGARPDDMAFNTPRWALPQLPPPSRAACRRPEPTLSFSSACTQMRVCQQACVSRGCCGGVRPEQSDIEASVALSVLARSVHTQPT